MADESNDLIGGVPRAVVARAAEMVANEKGLNAGEVLRIIQTSFCEGSEKLSYEETLICVEVYAKLPKAAYEMGDTQVAAYFRWGIEADVRRLPSFVQHVAGCAALAAERGLSEEDWMLEIWKEYRADRETLAQWLIAIAALQTEGPWPWPRDLE